MARLVCTISIDPAGLEPMQASFGTLHEALDTANFEGVFDFEYSSAGVFFLGAKIVALHVGKPVLRDDSKLVAPLFATPTFRMPLFAAEICRLVPGVKVRWVDGWPHFSAPEDDDPDDDTPDPVAPEELTPCLA